MSGFRELRAIGIQPDVLLCRTDRYLSPDIKSKLALYCDVPEEAVITAKDVDSIYEVPLVLSGEGLDAIVLKVLGLESRGRDMSAWERLVQRIKNPKGEVVIGIVGKYVSFEDSYKSLNEALTHGGFGNDVRVVRRWVEAEDLEYGNADAKLRGVDVRVMLPNEPDHKLVWLASIAHADAMIEHGVSIYRYQDGFLHQKVVLMDDQIASIGSVPLPMSV